MLGSGRIPLWSILRLPWRACQSVVFDQAFSLPVNLHRRLFEFGIVSVIIFSETRILDILS